MEATCTCSTFLYNVHVHSYYCMCTFTWCTPFDHSVEYTEINKHLKYTMHSMCTHVHVDNVQTGPHIQNRGCISGQLNTFVYWGGVKKISIKLYQGNFTFKVIILWKL